MKQINSKMNFDLSMASILVVDDELANVRLLEKLLSTVGFKNVTCTQDPKQTLPLFQQHDSDIILLDLNMPELDGYGVLEQLNTATGGNPPPVLILTAQHNQSDRQRALDNGARDYVTKPFYTDELLSRVKNLLEMHIAQKFILQQNEFLDQKVRERTQAIQDTRLQVVRRLGRAAEYRDNETGLHIIRMSKVAFVLGKAAGMDAEECELLLNASPMHDIGKIGIPDHILLKPGKLSPEEWKTMKTHTRIGADILSGDDSDLMRMAHDIALTHHEKWDGTGYPGGISGEIIPLTGRITALADVFDALTSERPYKAAWSIDKAINYIQEQSGQHFDPELVRLFQKNLPEIIEIMEQYAEPDDHLKVATK